MDPPEYHGEKKQAAEGEIPNMISEGLAEETVGIQRRLIQKSGDPTDGAATADEGYSTLMSNSDLSDNLAEEPSAESMVQALNRARVSNTYSANFFDIPTRPRKRAREDEEESEPLATNAISSPNTNFSSLTETPVKNRKRARKNEDDHEEQEMGKVENTASESSTMIGVSIRHPGPMRSWNPYFPTSDKLDEITILHQNLARKEAQHRRVTAGSHSSTTTGVSIRHPTPLQTLHPSFETYPHLEQLRIIHEYLAKGLLLVGQQEQDTAADLLGSLSGHASLSSNTSISLPCPPREFDKLDFLQFKDLGFLNYATRCDRFNKGHILDGPCITGWWLDELHPKYRKQVWPADGTWSKVKIAICLMKAERENENAIRNMVTEKDKRIVKYWSEKKKRVQGKYLDITSGSSSSKFQEYPRCNVTRRNNDPRLLWEYSESSKSPTDYYQIAAPVPPPASMREEVDTKMIDDGSDEYGESKKAVKKKPVTFTKKELAVAEKTHEALLRRLYLA